MTALERLEALKWGGPLQRESLSSTVSCLTTPTELMVKNPRRIQAVFVNKGANPTHVDFTQQVSTTQGFFLAANGGTVALLYEEDAEDVFGPFFGLAENAAVTLYRRGVELAQPRKVA